MKLDVTKSIRTFTLTFSEEEAGVLKGIVGPILGLYGGPPPVTKALYNLLRNENVATVGHYKSTPPTYLLTEPNSGVDRVEPEWADDWDEDEDDD